MKVAEAYLSSNFFNKQKYNTYNKKVNKDNGKECLATFHDHLNQAIMIRKKKISNSYTIEYRI